MKTFNFRGLGSDGNKRRQAFQWLKEKKIQVVCGQETHSTKEIENEWRDEWGGDIVFSHGTSAARGTFILFGKDINKTIHRQIICDDGRYVILDITIDNTRFTLAAIYAPNTDSPEYFSSLRQKIESIPNNDRIIGGDYNLVLNLLLDKRGGKNTTHIRAQNLILQWMNDTELVDIWREQHPNEETYTWSQKNPTPVFCRLDFFLVSRSLANKIESSQIIPGFRSDHSAVVLNINLNKTERGKGYWKLNCSHLNNPEYVQKIKNVIKETADLNRDANPNILWDTIKSSIRGESIKFSAKEKKKFNNEIIRLENEINSLEKMQQDRPLNEEQETLLNRNKLLLIDTIDKKAKGAYIRSRAQNYEEGEKNSSHFFNLEKRNASKKNIEKLQIGENKYIEDQTEILEEMSDFYKNLYTAEKLEAPINFIRTVSPAPNIPEESLENLNSDFDESEIKASMDQMNNNKSPGEDGLPVEFYKTFWAEIKPFLIEAYNYSMATGSLSITQKRGIISLLPKKKDLLFLQNWRPLTLLNVDYKILAKLIATRLKTILNYIIHTDQTGFMKGRYIGENIVTLLDIIEYCEKYGLEAVLIAIDFEKAFDQLDWNYIWEALSYFNIPDKLIYWIKTLYNDSNSCVTNNGFMSRYFKMGRGVRQGCPLSPYLFIIASEVLARSMRENKKIMGIKIGNQELKIKQYADDMQNFSIFDKNSINAIFANLEKFNKVSGSKVNFDKSHLLRLGPIGNTNATCSLNYTVKWTNGPLEILGMEILPEINSVTNPNLQKIIPKIKGIANSWENRKLTLYGKSNVINSLLGSKLVYRLSALPSPEPEFFIEIENIFFEFLWSNIKTKIAKNLVMNSREKGGLKILDIKLKEKSLKIAWIKRLLLNNNVNSYSPFLSSEAKIDIPTLIKCNLNPRDLSDCFYHTPPVLWGNILTHWFEYYHTTANNVQDPGNEIIWFNSNIKINNKTVYYKSMFQSNIIKIKHLYGEGNNWLTLNELKERYRTIDINFLQYASLLHAIPKEYKIRLTVANTGQKNKISEIEQTEKIPKLIYNKEIQNRDVFPDMAYNKHKTILQDITENTFLNAFDIMYTCTYSTKLKDFQYRFLHMRINTNKDRFRYGQIQSDLCTFCRSTEEDINHLLFKCPISKNIWTFVETYLQRKTNILIKFSDTDLIFGSEFFPFFKLYNHIILLAKQYIYACRCKNILPDVNVLKSKIIFEYHLEKNMDFSKRHQEKVGEKWGPILDNDII